MPAQATAATYLLPISAMFWGWSVLGERVRPDVLPGLLLVLQDEPLQRIGRQQRGRLDHHHAGFGAEPHRKAAVAEHLDHLEALGVTAIYLNPIFASASNHR